MKPPASDEILLRVSVPHFVAGVIVKDGRIIHAAPILRWAIGKTPGELARWVRTLKGTVEQC